MTAIARYVHTLRYLRPVQIGARLWHRLYRPPPDLRPAPARRSATGRWLAPLLREPELTGPSTIRIFGDEREIVSARDWQDVHPALLWIYHLHYFDDLASTGTLAWQRAFVARWLEDNPPASGHGWDPYPTSLRIVRWIRWLLLGADPPASMIDSLAIQARHLRRRIEHHLLGNHLFVNAKALVFAGAFFEGAEADGWIREGRRLLDRELDEQILADGGHFERSPMYHALILEDVLDLLALERVYPGFLDEDRLKLVAACMLRWLAAMTHPDGGIALFNDATFGIAPDLAALTKYAASFDIAAPLPVSPVTDLQTSGYARLEHDGAVLIVDAGELGPDYLLGHGHADTLSFELSIHGRRVIVDSGVSEYGVSPERVRQRGTAAHNTVVVDGEDSSEVWSGFRVARRARVHGRRVDATSIVAQHDGYRRLPDPVTHRRTWRFSAARLEISDELAGAGTHRVAIPLHLSPGLHAAVPEGDGVWSLGDGIRVEVDRRLTWSVRAGTYHPAMGVVKPAEILVGETEARLPFRTRIVVTWISR